MKLCMQLKEELLGSLLDNPVPFIKVAKWGELGTDLTFCHYLQRVYALEIISRLAQAFTTAGNNALVLRQ